MEKITIYTTNSAGKKIPVEVKINKNLKRKKTNSNSILRKRLATAGLVLMIGTGILSGCNLFKQNDMSKNEGEELSTSVSQTADVDYTNSDLRFDVNSKENIVDNAVFLIKEAANCGVKLDAEDAVLATIAANSNHLTFGFMGELFGEKANQTYTYDMITDAYLKCCLLQLETMGTAKTYYRAFNMENIFASYEDYEYLNKLRSMTTLFNISPDESKRSEIIKELNNMALDLCTYENLDISSPAGVLAMLSLDGMRVVTNNIETPILHDDIRDEMFGNNTYSCKDANILPTAYSNRVSDLKLDNLKAKLDSAILEEGKTTILKDIITEVKEQTKDIEIADFDRIAEINNVLGFNTKDDFSKPDIANSNNQNIQNNGGSSEKNDNDITTSTKPETPSEEDVNSKLEEDVETPVINPEIQNPEVTTPTEPEFSVEENIKPNPDEEVIDKGNVEQNKQEAEEQVKSEWEIAQEESNKGSADGMAYGLSGKSRPSFAGKSQYYINAFNASYDVYYQIYVDAKKQQDEFSNQQTAANTEDVTNATEDINLDGLSVEQLNALKDSTLTTSGNTVEDNKTYTK